jgi:hypothetical protein
MTRVPAILLACLACGCNPGASSAEVADSRTTPPEQSSPSKPSPPAEAHPTGPERSCAILLSRQGRDAWSLTLELQNRTDHPIESRYHHPLTFELEVWSASRRLDVTGPPYDGPVEPRSVRVPAGERVRIPTPITLRFDPTGSQTTKSPFDWIVVGSPSHVWLRAKRAFSDMQDLPCEVRMHVQ